LIRPALREIHRQDAALVRTKKPRPMPGLLSFKIRAHSVPRADHDRHRVEVIVHAELDDMHILLNFKPLRERKRCSVKGRKR
jgi:hypothetical protein